MSAEGSAGGRQPADARPDLATLPEGAQTVEAAWAFVDLVGYSAATVAHGDPTAARLAIRLVELAHCAAHGDVRVIKALGDAVLVQAGRVDDAIRWLAVLWELVDDEVAFPSLRAGISAGSAIAYDGDVYGSTVNIAARLADEAGPDTVLVTSEVARVAECHGWHSTALGPRQLKNMGSPIEVYQLLDTGRGEVHLDPVCLMRVAAGSATVLSVDGGPPYFCSTSCLERFVTTGTGVDGA